MIGRILAAAWVASLAIACGGAPNAAAPNGGHIAEVHRSRCGACHVRVEPGQRTRAELETALHRHRKRVHLDETEWADLVDYLASDRAAASAQPLPDSAAANRN
jgi:hypothetical protein